MRIHVRLVEGPIERDASRRVDGAGAVVTFEGVVRPGESGRTISALDYEAYEPMTSRELHRLGEKIGHAHGLLAMEIMHSVGRVSVGECSFRLEVAGVHRKEALEAMDEFIDEMKRTVPLWKVPVWADAEVTS